MSFILAARYFDYFLLWVTRWVHNSHTLCTNQITKNSEMVLLLHLPRFPLYLITSSQSLPLRALATSSKTTLLRPPKASLTTTEPVTVANPSATELSLEKLFVPPETTVSLDTARVLNGSNIILSKYANDALISQAEFVKSSVKTEDCPSDGLPEFALVGRSNVGKSSLLNSLVRRKKLALTSKKPGPPFFY